MSQQSVRDVVLSDLYVESEFLDSFVRGLDHDRWASVTTPEGWTVAHQIAHLHWTDMTAVAAAQDGAAFARIAEAADLRPSSYVDEVTEKLAALPPYHLLDLWRAGRGRLHEALSSVDEDRKIPWFGPPMSPTSMATARFMETWAHGHDLTEGLGIEYPVSDRCRHVCHLGVRTRRFAYLAQGERVPDVEIHVSLTAPGGEIWTWGPPRATERVSGSANDFALLATRRRHADDTDVRAEGPHAAHWLTIIQAFAGLPGNAPLRLSDR